MEMNWVKLLNKKRFKQDASDDKSQDARTEFERDIDRIVFSTAFRRMQDKTQVFPVPQSDFVHNRLTHSLEVASVGRSLGTLVGKWLEERESLPEGIKYNDVADIVYTACLAHDLGNTPFGHSGEKSISQFFQDNPKSLRGMRTEEKNDLTTYDGNATGFRLLTNKHSSGEPGGLRLTYASLGAFIKYPTASPTEDWENIIEKKYKKIGVFQSELIEFQDIANELGLIKYTGIEHFSNLYCRHPLSYLMEAADNICYTFIDFEDGLKIGVRVDEDHIKVFESIAQKNPTFTLEKAERIKKKDWNEYIGYLRTKCINKLIYEAYEAFKINYSLIMSGELKGELTDHIESCSDFANLGKKNTIFYSYRPVLLIEAAGSKILRGILNEFIDAYENPNRYPNKKVRELIDKKIDFSENRSLYEIVMDICLYVSNMSDGYAISTYRQLTGDELPKIY